MKNSNQTKLLVVALCGLIFTAINCRDYSDILLDKTAPNWDAASVAGASNASDQVTLTWSAASDNLSTSSGINFEICFSQTPGGCNNFTVNFASPAGATQYTVTGLAPATFYYFRIRPRDQAGNTGTTSSDLQVKTALPAIGVPGFTPSAGSYNATQNVAMTSATAGAIICYTTNGIDPVCNATPSCTTGTQTANGGTASVASSLTLKAIACATSSTPTTPVSAAYVIDSVVPSQPTGLAGLLPSTTQINLSWTASTDNLTPQPNIVYEICQSTTAGVCGTTFTATYTTTGGAINYNVTGLTIATQYYFLIKAVDLLGNHSAASAPEVAQATQNSGTVLDATFSPVAGSYNATQNVAISSATPSATICYTAGPVPVCDAPKTGCTTGTLYAGPISVSTSQSLRALACRFGYVDSATAPTASYTIDSTPPSAPASPTATPPSGTQIDLSWTASTDNLTAQGAIVYEICQAGTSGLCSPFSATYTNAAGVITRSVTGLTPSTPYYFVVRARDSLNNTAVSSEFTATTLSGSAVATPTFSPSAGIYGGTQSVSISSATPGSTMCYTTDGVTTPACNATPACTTGTTYTVALSVSASQTLKAIGCKATYTNSAVATGAFTIDAVAPSAPTAPSATPSGSTQLNLAWTAGSDAVTPVGSLVYDVCQTTVNNGCSTFVATYTTAAGVTTQNATGLTPITLYYFVVRTRDQAGNVAATSQFSQTTGNNGTVATPTFSPVAGTYGLSQNVTISTTTGSAIMCYTTTGTAPVCDAPKTGCTTGTLYSTTVAVSSSQTLKAIGCLATWIDSAVGTAAYTIDVTPPTTPTAFTGGTPISATQINLTWTASTDTLTAQASIVYEICQSTTSGVCGGGFTATYTTGGGATAQSATSLTQGTTYYFMIRARDADGHYSTPSGEISAATPTRGFTLSAISGATTEVGGTATFTVVLKTLPTASVSVGLSSNNTAEGTVSPASLTFTVGNWNSPQTVTVTGVADNKIDGNTAYTIITAAATSGDAGYNSLDPADVSVTNNNNDVGKYIYVTTATTKGTLGTANCATDVAIPRAGTYSGIISTYDDNGGSPLFSDAYNPPWALLPNQKYYRGVDGAYLGTTDANAIFVFPLATSFHNAAISYWTGLDASFNLVISCSVNLLTAVSWASGLVTKTGTIGDGLSTSSTAIDNGTSTCITFQHLLCAEQP